MIIGDRVKLHNRFSSPVVGAMLMAPSRSHTSVTEPSLTGSRQVSSSMWLSLIRISRIMTACVTAATTCPACREPMSWSAAMIRCCASLSRSPIGHTASAGADR